MIRVRVSRARFVGRLVRSSVTLHAVLFLLRDPSLRWHRERVCPVALPGLGAWEGWAQPVGAGKRGMQSV